MDFLIDFPFLAKAESQLVRFFFFFFLTPSWYGVEAASRSVGGKEKKIRRNLGRKKKLKVRD